MADAGTTLLTVRMVNGQVRLELPDDPNVGEGPTRFEINLVNEQVNQLGAGLPAKVRERMVTVMNAHVRALQDIAEQAHHQNLEAQSRTQEAIAQRAAMETS